MFAPCPLIDGEIKMVLTSTEGDELEVYPFSDIINEHRVWRMTHHGDLSIHGSNLIHWVSTDVIDWSTDDLQLIDLKAIELNETLSYILLKRMAYGWAKQNDFPLKKAEIECQLKNVKTGAEHLVVYPKMIWNVE